MSLLPPLSPMDCRTLVALVARLRSDSSTSSACDFHRALVRQGQPGRPLPPVSPPWRSQGSRPQVFTRLCTSFTMPSRQDTVRQCTYKTYQCWYPNDDINSCVCGPVWFSESQQIQHIWCIPMSISTGASTQSSSNFSSPSDRRASCNSGATRRARKPGATGALCHVEKK